MTDDGTKSLLLDLDALDATITQALHDWQVPGVAVAIVQDDAVVLSKGYGVRKLGEAAPVDNTTVFAIASCTKAFTAATIAMLVDEGKLKLDDRVTQYLPEFQLADPYVTRELSIRDLLCHRSGLPTFGGDLIWFGTTYSRDEVLRRVRYVQPTSSFRSQFGYQNIMFVAAGKIVEVVTGKSWDAFVHERIFAPLDMTASTTSFTQFKNDDPLATPHIERNGTMQAIGYLDEHNAAPAGGINSPVADMTRWIMLQLGRGTYRDQQLWSAAMAQEMWSPQMVIPLTDQVRQRYPSTHLQAYGLGWFLRDYAGRLLVVHDGGLPGMASRVGLLPEANVGFVILSNSESLVPLVIGNTITDMTLGVAPRDWNAELLAVRQTTRQEQQAAQAMRESEHVQGTHPSLALAGYVGRYEDQAYGVARIDEAHGKLSIQLVPSPALLGDLEHWHYDTFRVTWRDPYIPPGLVTFTLDARGKVATLHIDSPNPDFDFTALQFKRTDKEDQS